MFEQVVIATELSEESVIG